MRQLNNNEKAIIKDLVIANGLKESAIIGLIDKLDGILYIRWDDKYTQLEIYTTVDKHQTCFDSLLELVFLLDYLYDNRYISIYNFSKEFGNCIHHKRYEILDDDGIIRELRNNEIVEKNVGGTKYSGDSVLRPNAFIIYTDLGKKLKQYSKGLFFVSESLKELVKKDFQTEEQIRFESQMKMAEETLKCSRACLKVAFITLVVTILLAQCS